MLMFSRRDLENMSRKLLSQYLRRSQAQHDRIDPEDFAKTMFGIEYEFRKLSTTGEVLGMTSFDDFGVEVWDAEGTPEWFCLDRYTALIDLCLMEEGQEGRRHFTMMHEAAHQILRIFFPSEYGVQYRTMPVRYYLATPMRGRVTDWEEWQANVLASSLLLPRELILKHMDRLGLKPIRILNKRYAIREYELFSSMAETLGVSRQALAIRMKQLGLLEREYLRNPDDLLNVYMEDDEWKTYLSPAPTQLLQ